MIKVKLQLTRHETSWTRQFALMLPSGHVGSWKSPPLRVGHLVNSLSIKRPDTLDEFRVHGDPVVSDTAVVRCPDQAPEGRSKLNSGRQICKTFVWKKRPVTRTETPAGAPVRIPRSVLCVQAARALCVTGIGMRLGLVTARVDVSSAWNSACRESASDRGGK